MVLLLLEVFGEPAPQGSKRHVGGGRMIEASKKVGPWRVAVAEAVAAAVPADQRPLFNEPVRLTAIYYLPRPKSVRRFLPSVPPDKDKLDRGLFDALTIAGVWTDDALVIDSRSVKLYADSRPSGAVVLIEPLIAARKGKQ